MRRGSIILFWFSGALLAAFSVAALTGCAASDAPVAPTLSVQSQFFPLDNGLIYTYMRFLNNQNDTLNLRLITAQPGFQNVFVYNGTQDTFYRVGLTHDADFNVAAVISTDTSSLMALDGSLEMGDTWIADDVHHIRATVIARYDDYYLPDV